jgi:regulatory protein
MGWGTGGRRPSRDGSASTGRVGAVPGRQVDGELGEAGADAPRRPQRPGLSLKGRALKLLSQREHSRLELTRKLAPHAASTDSTDSTERLESLLDELERAGFLSSQRFAESLAHRRAPRFGLRRIEHELGAHRLDAAVAGPVLQGLRDTERDRALQAWRKRFGQPATDAAERAKHHRFLAQRGFTGEAIHWVLRQGADRVAELPEGDLSEGFDDSM